MRHIVVSVPHSGTRTLVQHLGLDHYEHFFTNRKDLLAHTDFYAHIPVRHPLDVAKSWATRCKVGSVLDDLLDSYAMMFRFIKRKPHELHRIEDMTTIVGSNESRVCDCIDRVAEFQTAITEQVISPHHEFFAQYYPVTYPVARRLESGGAVAPDFP